MKSFSLIIALLFSLTPKTINLINADTIAGTWWNAEKDARIRIFKAINNRYSGKIEWMKEPNDAKGNPKTDNNNPNEKLRSTPRMGLVIMKNFDYNSTSKKWENGTIYDPKNGKTYDGYIYFEGNNFDKLKLRGYVLGMSWLGRTSEWQRFE
ncbi:MAG: DUF2147 domain-containing protein [Flavobacteriales bacterium]|nr:DUF2147 domain-containing protein [Flavobacteriales bacterium]